jgi:hypothetical protein
MKIMNIFARELALLMRDQGGLGHLYAAEFDLPPNKVTRLRRSLTEDITALLNAEQLEHVATVLGLSAPQRERLNAALLAETIHRLLAGRTDRDDAQLVADLVFDLLTTQQTSELDALRQRILSQTRDALRGIDTAPEPVPVTGERIAAAFEHAAELTDRALLVLALAAHEDDERAGYVAQARALLGQARRLAQYPPTFAMNTDEQRQILAGIADAEREADRLG